MPFVPPAAPTGRPRSVCGPGQTGEDTQIKRLSLPPATALDKTKASVDKNCSSVKERLALNLRHLGRKSQPRTYLPTAKVVAAPGLHVKSRDQWLPSSKAPSGVSPTPSRSGEAVSKIPLYSHIRHDATAIKSNPQVDSRAVSQEEACFTLTLTPEAVRLLQRRSMAAKSAAAGAGATESGSKRQSPSKRDAPVAPPQHTTQSNRATITTHSKGAALVDIRSIVKISLLNEQHKYDDVEYEEEGDCGVDERVVLKCTEWLCGLENSPVTTAMRPVRGQLV
ncbi:unnamed protein product [Merluccius merluccius]